jgi:hypothetical protein
MTEQVPSLIFHGGSFSSFSRVGRRIHKITIYHQQKKRRFGIISRERVEEAQGTVAKVVHAERSTGKYSVHIYGVGKARSEKNIKSRSRAYSRK